LLRGEIGRPLDVLEIHNLLRGEILFFNDAFLDFTLRKLALMVVSRILWRVLKTHADKTPW
jgi:hypothetical protein